MMIKSILVPVDGSDHSERALKLAAGIAEKYNACLTILYVASFKLSDELWHYATYEYSVKNENDTYLVSDKIGKSIINRMLDKLKTNVSANSAVLHGNPADKIAEYSKRNGFDAIVMGSRGLGFIRCLILKSVSRKVNKLTNCIFVTVK